MTETLIPFDAAAYLATRDGVEEYLIAGLESGDLPFVRDSFEVVGRASGLGAFAEHHGLSAERLRDGWSPEHFDHELMLDVIYRLGWRLAPSRAA